MLHELRAVMQILSNHVDKKEEQASEVKQKEIQLIDKRGPLKNDFPRLPKLHLVEQVQSFVADQSHPLLVLDGRDVVEGVLAQLYLEDVVIFDDGELGQILDPSQQLNCLGFFVEAEVYLVFFGHSV